MVALRLLSGQQKIAIWLQGNGVVKMLMEPTAHNAIWTAILTRIHARMSAGETQSSLALSLGVHKTVLGRWITGEKGGKKASIDDLLRYMQILDIDPTPYLAPFLKAKKEVPLIGLAACGYEYWEKEVKLPISATAAPPGELAPNMFAIIASGESLVPVGIEAGFLAFCNPDKSPNPGDVVFVERINGTMSLKVFRRLDGSWTILEGWLPPDKEGQQEKYTLSEPTADIVRLAPVIFIKRRD